MPSGFFATRLAGADPEKKLGPATKPPRRRKDRSVKPANYSIVESLEKSRRGRVYCLERAEQLIPLARSNPEGKNHGRWVAHADATVAELLRYRFMLGQYHQVLEREWTRHGRRVPEGQRYVVRNSRRREHLVDMARARQQYNRAASRIQLLIDRHKGTPWEKLGRRMKRDVFAWTCSLGPIPEPERDKDHDRTPSPPRLPF